MLVINQLNAQNLFLQRVYYTPLHVSSTVVLIIRRSKLYYTASGIVTPVGGRPVHRLREDSLSVILVINQLNAQNLVL